MPSMAESPTVLATMMRRVELGNITTRATVWYLTIAAHLIEVNTSLGGHHVCKAVHRVRVRTAELQSRLQRGNMVLQIANRKRVLTIRLVQLFSVEAS